MRRRGWRDPLSILELLLAAALVVQLGPWPAGSAIGAYFVALLLLVLVTFAAGRLAASRIGRWIRPQPFLASLILSSMCARCRCQRSISAASPILSVSRKL